MMKARNRITEGFDIINKQDRAFCRSNLVFSLVLAFLSFWALGASWSSPPPDPVGEQLYRTHILMGIIPLAIITGALLVAWLVAKGRRKAKSLEGLKATHKGSAIDRGEQSD
jgi:hypothetical protein